MTAGFHHLGAEADPELVAPRDFAVGHGSTATPLTDEVEHKLEELDVPIPQPIGETQGPRGGETLVFRPEPVAEPGPVRSTADLQPAPTGINPKDAVGMTKPDLSLVPPASALYQAQAMMDGARKYGPYNWRSNPVLMRVYIAAAQRHLSQLLDGEDFDPISGCHHLGHALACMGILADARETGNLVDDRPVPGPAGEMIRHFGDFKTFDRSAQ